MPIWLKLTTYNTIKVLSMGRMNRFIPDYRKGFQKDLLPGRFTLDIAVFGVEAPMGPNERLARLICADLDPGDGAVLGPY